MTDWMPRAQLILAGNQAIPFEPRLGKTAPGIAPDLPNLHGFAARIRRNNSVMSMIAIPAERAGIPARRVLATSSEAHDHGLCQNSNLCVPAQMLGMKGVCYNPEVVKLRRARR